MFPGSAWLLCSLGLLIFFPCLFRTGIFHLEQTGHPQSQESFLLEPFPQKFLAFTALQQQDELGCLGCPHHEHHPSLPG